MNHVTTNELRNMFKQGVCKIAQKAEYINELNVFPVPDGDTGTNMKITSSVAFDEIAKLSITDVSIFGQAFSRALLMNARGNSGVIFSQFIKGFVQPLEPGNVVKKDTFIDCFKNAKDTAYAAVAKPVEGTILTIIRVVAEEVEKNHDSFDDIKQLFAFVEKVAKKALNDTPNLLPELKKVGVVDSGGYGLWCFISGMREALLSNSKLTATFTSDSSTKKESVKRKHSFFDEHDYEEGFGYCSEIILKINSHINPNDEDDEKKDFYLDHFKSELLKIGDSLVCVQDSDLVKVHIHTTTPGLFLNLAQKYGEFVKIKIENMTEQFYTRMKNQGIKVINTIHTNPLEIKLNPTPEFVVTCPSKKIKKILQKDYGFKYVINTEETGNPSIQDILIAIQKTKSKNVVFITDDANITLAANQVIGILKSTINIRVVTGTNIFEALVAALEFDPNVSLDINKKNMTKAIDASYSAKVSRSVKDVNYSDINLSRDDFIAVIDKKIVVADTNEFIVLQKTIDSLMSKVKHADVLMIFYDNSKRLSTLKKLEEYVNQKYNFFCEFREGGQKVYSYYIGLQ